ncbi:MAG: hypothetical protein HQ596_02370 [Candidatus Saganbacteria bacterium]|nr:hypothetical protein [Candidatus Saganbacteria bacterium]
MFALITKKLLKPGWSEETGYTFKDVYCYIETGSPDKSSHQMLLVEMGIEGGFLLSNNRAYWLDRTDERSIERKVSELLYRQDTMEELSDDDLVRLPQFYLVVLEEGQALEENSSKAKKISYMSPDL